ncbi:MAG: [NiFe]-hydrogenase assembly chaperone HybE [Gammaproteobacteria bacterium]|nr:[NiFe]-hydrogenase assembly chaperone HybE [Gammaproteobacteria bacterium]
MSDAVAALVQHFEMIDREHMQGMPIVNPALYVEAVGFRKFEQHECGVLITPWFMNLVLLPGSDAWSDVPQGSTVGCALPAGRYDFMTSRDDALGTYLTAVLFRTVVDFPDQATAREIGSEVLEQLFVATGDKQAPTSSNAETLSRRSLFTMLGGQ